MHNLSDQGQRKDGGLDYSGQRSPNLGKLNRAIAYGLVCLNVAALIGWALGLAVGNSAFGLAELHASNFVLHTLLL